MIYQTVPFSIVPELRMTLYKDKYAPANIITMW